jgi:hypothetical protein
MSDLEVAVGKSNSSGKSGGIGGTIFLILFATPFAGFGLVAVVQGVKKLIAGQIKDGLMLCLFGLIFSTVGFGLMFGAVWSRKKSKQTADLQTRFADKPWMLRADWAAGKIKSKFSAPVGIYLLWSFLALAMSAPALFSIQKEWQKGNHAILVVLLFPAVAFYLLGYSFVLWRSRRRFGDCSFEMAQIPAPLGGTLEGVIQTGARLKLEHGLHLKMTCIRRVTTSSGKNSSTREDVLWQDEKVIRPEAALPEPEPCRTGIPVFFKLPADLPESIVGNGDGVHWRLEAKAKMSGPDFSTMFEVPVFLVAGTATVEAEASDPTAALQESVEELRRDEHSKIQVTDGPDGREFYFPAARNLGTAIGMTIFLGIWTGAIWAMTHFHAPLLFPILFGFFEIAILWICFNLWFKSSRVTIDSSGVNAVTRWLVFSRTRRFAANDIARFETKTGMQSGNHIFQNINLITRANGDSFEANKAKYQQTGQMPPLKFRMGNPGGVTVADCVASTAETNWLVQEMTKALGRK